MPNHVHGVLVRVQSITTSSPTTPIQPYEQGQTKGQLHTYRTHPQRMSMLNEMMRTFKAVTSHTIRKNGTSSFAWQRDYYEHIIRNQDQLDFVRTYISNNPATWQDDKLHPNMFKPDF